MILEIWNSNILGAGTVFKTNSTGKPVWLNILISNNGSSSIVFNMGIRKPTDGEFTRICPKNLTLEAGECFELNNIAFLPASILKFTTTGNTDYYIAVHEDYTQQW